MSTISYYHHSTARTVLCLFVSSSSSHALHHHHRHQHKTHAQKATGSPRTASSRRLDRCCLRARVNLSFVRRLPYLTAIDLFRAHIRRKGLFAVLRRRGVSLVLQLYVFFFFFIARKSVRIIFVQKGAAEGG